MSDRETSRSERALLSWKNARVLGGIAAAAAALIVPGRNLLDSGHPECGSEVQVSTARTPAVFLDYKGEAYSLYMPIQYLGEQKLTIVRGDIDGERARSTPVTLRMVRDESGLQHAATRLPESDAILTLEYDSELHTLQTACTDKN